MKITLFSLTIISTVLLFSCKDNNESPSEKEMDLGPVRTEVDSAKFYNGHADDSVARVTPSNATE